MHSTGWVPILQQVMPQPARKKKRLHEKSCSRFDLGLRQLKSQNYLASGAGAASFSGFGAGTSAGGLGAFCTAPSSYGAAADSDGGALGTSIAGPEPPLQVGAGWQQTGWVQQLLLEPNRLNFGSLSFGRPVNGHRSLDSQQFTGAAQVAAGCQQDDPESPKNRNPALA